MGFFDSSAIGAFRYTKDGRRIYARRYLVSDADLGRVRSRIRASAITAAIFAGVATSSARHILGESWWWLALPLIVPLVFVFRHWIASDLPVVLVHKVELEPVDRRALSLAQAQAIGRPALWILLVFSVLLTALAVDVVFVDGVWEWTGWFLLLVMPACAVGIGRQLWQLRTESPSASSRHN